MATPRIRPGWPWRPSSIRMTSRCMASPPIWGQAGAEGQITFEFAVDDTVPHHLFKTELFDQTLHEDLSTKPTCQKSYQEQYRNFMQPIVDREYYSRFYYQLHKNVDQEMMKVYQALRNSRFYEDTIVIFTSDHGDLLGGMAICTRNGTWPMRKRSMCR